jgi:flavin reductase (DIM6/NTAB) family NADH-FMN oxidoreductase RutF
MQGPIMTTEIHPLVSEEAFKGGMQLLASSVTVITSEFEGTRRGMTATAVCSLAASPPSIILCVNQNARTYDHLMKSGKFCINVLSAEQQDIAEIFATSKGDSGDKFTSSGTWSSSESDQPMLNGCLVNFVCEIDRCIPANTHMVVIGLVKQIRTQQDLFPLLYLGRNFFSPSPTLSR